MKSILLQDAHPVPIMGVCYCMYLYWTTLFTSNSVCVCERERGPTVAQDWCRQGGGGDTGGVDNSHLACKSVIHAFHPGLKQPFGFHFTFQWSDRKSGCLGEVGCGGGVVVCGGV